MSDAHTVSIWFPGEWPDLNSYIDAERANRYRAAKLKRVYTDKAREIAKAAGVGRVHTPCEVRFIWHLADGRKDPDNVAAMGCKVILDGLVRAGVLPNDGQKQIWRIVHEFVKDGREGVRVELTRKDGGK